MEPVPSPSDEWTTAKIRILWGQTKRSEDNLHELSSNVKYEETNSFEIYSRFKVKIYWHKEGFSQEQAKKLKITLERHGIQCNVLQHRNPSPPDSIFIGNSVTARGAKLVLENIPYDIRYIFPLTYPNKEGGDITGHSMGVGYLSTHNKNHRNLHNTPIALSKDDFYNLTKDSFSDEEFQRRLKKLASPVS